MPVDKQVKKHRRQLIERVVNEHRIRQTQGAGQRVNQRDDQSSTIDRAYLQRHQNLADILRENYDRIVTERCRIVSELSGNSVGLYRNDMPWEYTGVEYINEYPQSERQEGIQDAPARAEPQPSPSHYYVSSQYRNWISASSTIRSPRTRT